MTTRRNYSTWGLKLKCALLIFLVALMMAGIYLEFIWEPQPEYVAVIPMANQHITWEGAGYKREVNGCV